MQYSFIFKFLLKWPVIRIRTITNHLKINVKNVNIAGIHTDNRT